MECIWNCHDSSAASRLQMTGMCIDGHWVVLVALSMTPDALLRPQGRGLHIIRCRSPAPTLPRLSAATMCPNASSELWSACFWHQLQGAHSGAKSGEARCMPFALSARACAAQQRTAARRPSQPTATARWRKQRLA